MPDLIDLLARALPHGYTVRNAIGQGGQGAVFRGTKSGTDVAIKLFGPTDPARLTREIALLRNSTSPNLARVVDFFSVTIEGVSVPTIVYEFVEGPTLRDEIASPG